METPRELVTSFDGSFRLDPMLPQRQFEHFIGRVSDPNHAAMIENFREHVYQEMIGLDIERLMATMVDEPELRFHGLGVPSDVGHAAVREHYVKTFPSRAAGGVSLNIDRLMVDDDAVYFDGLGLFSLDFARENFGIDVSTDRPAVVAKQIAVLSPYRDGRIHYEAQYFAGPVTPDDVVLLD